MGSLSVGDGVRPALKFPLADLQDVRARLPALIDKQLSTVGILVDQSFPKSKEGPGADDSWRVVLDSGDASNTGVPLIIFEPRGSSAFASAPSASAGDCVLLTGVFVQQFRGGLQLLIKRVAGSYLVLPHQLVSAGCDDLASRSRAEAMIAAWLLGKPAHRSLIEALIRYHSAQQQSASAGLATAPGPVAIAVQRSNSAPHSLSTAAAHQAAIEVHRQQQEADARTAATLLVDSARNCCLSWLGSLRAKGVVAFGKEMDTRFRVLPGPPLSLAAHGPEGVPVPAHTLRSLIEKQRWKASSFSSFNFQSSSTSASSSSSASFLPSSYPTGPLSAAFTSGAAPGVADWSANSLLESGHSTSWEAADVTVCIVGCKTPSSPSSAQRPVLLASDFTIAAAGEDAQGRTFPSYVPLAVEQHPGTATVASGKPAGFSSSHAAAAAKPLHLHPRAIEAFDAAAQLVAARDRRGEWAMDEEGAEPNLAADDSESAAGVRRVEAGGGLVLEGLWVRLRNVAARQLQTADGNVSVSLWLRPESGMLRIGTQASPANLSPKPSSVAPSSSSSSSSNTADTSEVAMAEPLASSSTSSSSSSSSVVAPPAQNTALLQFPLVDLEADPPLPSAAVVFCRPDEPCVSRLSQGSTNRLPITPLGQLMSNASAAAQGAASLIRLKRVRVAVRDIDVSETLCASLSVCDLPASPAAPLAPSRGASVAYATLLLDCSDPDGRHFFSGLPDASLSQLEYLGELRKAIVKAASAATAGSASASTSASSPSSSSPFPVLDCLVLPLSNLDANNGRLLLKLVGSTACTPYAPAGSAAAV